MDAARARRAAPASQDRSSALPPPERFASAGTPLDPLRVPVRFVLPWPPTLNTAWRSGRSRSGKVIHYIAEPTRFFRQQSALRLLSQGARAWMLAGDLGVHITAYPPDRRARDLDNLIKPILDALQHAGVVADDASFARIEIRRSTMKPPGEVVLVLGRERWA